MQITCTHNTAEAPRLRRPQHTEAVVAEEREWCYSHAPTELTAVCKQPHAETKILLLVLNEIDGNLESLEYLEPEVAKLFAQSIQAVVEQEFAK